MSSRSDEMYDLNDDLDTLRTAFYSLFDFSREDYSEQKDLARREVLYAINELRIKAENY